MDFLISLKFTDFSPGQNFPISLKFTDFGPGKKSF